MARAVGLAFAVAASTFCPLLVLGIWWRRLTAAGAVAGLLAGGLGAGAGGRLDAVRRRRRRAGATSCSASRPRGRVPLAFATMVAVSPGAPATACRAHTRRFMVRLHTPEVVPLDRG